MKMFVPGMVSRRAFAVLAVVSAAVVTAVPAAADVVYPTWYGSAVKAMERMGIGEQDYPLWLQDDVARAVPTMTGDLKIDGRLADRPNGVPSDDDWNSLVRARRARLVYGDTTVDAVKLWDVYGKTYADGYAASQSGDLHYGDPGYVPTSDEIDEWSRKLSVTTSELQADSEVGASDASSGTETSGFVSRCGTSPRGVRQAAFRVSPASDAKPYSDRKMKKSEQYTELYTMDMDDGSSYAQRILEEEAKNGAGDAYSGDTSSNPSLRELEWGRHATARDRRIHKRLEKVKKAHSTLNHAIDTVNSWLEPFSWVRDGVHQIRTWFFTDDDICGSTAMMGDRSQAGENVMRFIFGVGEGLNCDEYDALHFPADGEAATSVRKFAKQSAEDRDKPKYQGENDGDLAALHYSYTPWYYADTPYGKIYMRSTQATDDKGHSLLMLQTNFTGGTYDAYSYPRNQHNDGSQVRSEGDWLLSKSDDISEGRIRISMLIPLTTQDRYAYNFSTYHLPLSDGNYALNDSYLGQTIPDDPYYTVSNFEYSVHAATFYGVPEYSRWALPGKADDIFKKLLVLVTPKDGDVGYDYVNGSHTNVGRKSDDFGGRTRMAANVHAWHKCDKSCPADLQTRKPKVRVKATAKDPQGNDVGSTVSDPADPGSVQVPASVTTPVGADGKTTASNISYDVVADDGTTQHVGDVAIPQVDATQKRLDLIDLTTGKSCFGEGYACASWYEETQQLIPDHQLTVSTKTTTKELPALRYKCSYDVPGKVTEVPIGECVAYAHSFSEKAQRSGDVGADPDGRPLDKPVAKADPKVDYGSCVKMETAGNALKWLYEPVACAGRVLFEPDDKVVTTTRTRVERSTRTSVVVKLDLIRDNWRPVFSDGLGDCHGYRVSFGFGGFKVFDDADFLNACPGQPLDWLPVLCRAFLTIACALGVMLLCRRAFMAIFDFHTGGDGQ